MTEIPEHLLKRSQEARARLGGGDAGGEAPKEEAAAETPAGDAAAAAPAEKKAVEPAPIPTLDIEEKKAKPDIPVVAAAKRRRRIPYWAASVLVALPLWGFIYAYSVQPPATPETDPLVIGEEVFSTAGCAGCHTAAGDGGAAGAQLNDGHAIETFKDPLAMVHWVAFGATGGARDDGTYGDRDRPGGVENVNTIANNMPAFANELTPEEIAAVVIYIRQEFGGDVYDPVNEAGFTAENFEADPEAFTKVVEEVIATGEGGDPEVADIERPGGGEGG